MENQNSLKVSLDQNTINSLVNSIRNVIRQEINFKNNPQQKPKIDPSKAVSIRDEIRKIVKEEIQAMKNNSSQQKPKINLPQTQNNKPKEFQKPVQQQNIVRITSVQELAAHLLRSINEQLQKRQQQLGKPVQKNQVQVSVSQNNKQSPIKPQSSSKDFAQKNTVSQKQAGDLLSSIAKKVPKPNQNQNFTQNKQKK